MFGAGRAAACRYVRVADRILAAMPPAPHRFVDTLRGVDSPEEFAAPFPGGARADTILFDGTHARFVRAKDGEVRDAMYSGKKKAHAGNTVVMATPDGMTIAISLTYRGSMHAIAITREFLGDLGAFADDVPGADMPEGTRGMVLRVLADSGFQGPEKDLPGAEVVTPVKRPRAGNPPSGRRPTTGWPSPGSAWWRTPSRPSSTTGASRPYARGRSRTLTPSSTSRAGLPTRGSCSEAAPTTTGSRS